MEMARARRNKKNSPDFVAKNELSFPAKLIFFEFEFTHRINLQKLPSLKT